MKSHCMSVLCAVSFLLQTTAATVATPPYHNISGTPSSSGLPVESMTLTSHIISRDAFSSEPSTTSVLVTILLSPNGTTATPLTLSYPSTSTCRLPSNATDCLPQSPSLSSTPAPTDSEQCVPLPTTGTVTYYSVVYTATTTIFGNASDYYPQFEVLRTPNYCSNTLYLPLPSTLPSLTTSQFGGPLLTGTKIRYPIPTITFVTTDKNPSVVQKPSHVPGYTSKHGRPPKAWPGQHHTAVKNPGPHDTKPTRSPHTVTARPTEVVVSDRPNRGLKPGSTRTATVGGAASTVGSAAMVGEGATVVKLAPGVTSSGYKPMSTTIDGVPLVISGDLAVIGGTTLTVPTSGTTAKINGHGITVGPGTLVANGETHTWAVSPPFQGNTIVIGGEMLTAIGPTVVVIQSTTITYGHGIDSRFTAVDDDTIIISEAGVNVHHSTIAGPAANPTATTYEIVGGLTIAELGPSIVAIGGLTLTLGEDTNPSTTTMGGEIVTIGPDGVVVSSMTYGVDPDSLVVSTIHATGSIDKGAPLESGSVNGTSSSEDAGEGEDDEDAGTNLRPSRILWGLCIVYGVWILV